MAAYTTSTKPIRSAQPPAAPHPAKQIFFDEKRKEAHDWLLNSMTAEGRDTSELPQVLERTLEQLWQRQSPEVKKSYLSKERAELERFVREYKRWKPKNQLYISAKGNVVDPNKPSRPPSGYQVFVKTEHSRVVDTLKSEGEPGAKVRGADVMKRLGAEWKALSEEQRAAWNSAAETEGAAALKAVQDYVAPSHRDVRQTAPEAFLAYQRYMEASNRLSSNMAAPAAAASGPGAIQPDPFADEISQAALNNTGLAQHAAIALDGTRRVWSDNAKRLHDRAKPAPPKSAWDFYVEAVSPSVMGRLGTTEPAALLKEIGSMWGGLSEDQRAPYTAAAEADIKRWQHAREGYALPPAAHVQRHARMVEAKFPAPVTVGNRVPEVVRAETSSVAPAVAEARRALMQELAEPLAPHVPSSAFALFEAKVMPRLKSQLAATAGEDAVPEAVARRAVEEMWAALPAQAREVYQQLLVAVRKRRQADLVQHANDLAEWRAKRSLLSTRFPSNAPSRIDLLAAATARAGGDPRGTVDAAAARQWAGVQTIPGADKAGS